MAALIEAAADPAYPAEVRVVVSNRLDADGLGIAAAAGIPTEVVPSKGQNREAFEDALDATLRAYGIRLVALAGFMRVLSPGFIARWPDRLVNVHPSLLPAFPGLATHARALAAGCKLHGCTVHLVRAEVDQGPILAQAAVPVEDGDTPDTLAARVLAAEHRLYPAAVADLAAGRIAVDGLRTRRSRD